MNTNDIRRQADAVDEARKELDAVRVQIRKVEGKHGQDCAALHINGVAFEITRLNRSYMPEVIKGMETIQRECIALLKAREAACASRLDGAEWKLRELAKEVA